jgi:hypothetical protein
MRLVRKTQQLSYEDASEVHKTAMANHDEVLVQLEDMNGRLNAAYEKEKKLHKERLAAYADECKRVDAQHEEQLAFHAEYEKARAERNEKIEEVRRKLPSPLPSPPPKWVTALLRWPRDPWPERPVPEHPGYGDEPLAPEPPTLIELSDYKKPQLYFPKPPVFEAVQVEEMETVETPWGDALATPGSWVLTNAETGEKHIEQTPAIETEYAEV